MSRFEICRINGNSDHITQFSNECHKYTGIKIPEAYTESASAFGLFQDGMMVGGFVIAVGPTIRCAAVVPEKILSQSDYLRKIHPQEWCEVNQVWMSDQVKDYKISLRLWLKIRKELLKLSPSVVFIPWIVTNKGLDRFYRTFVSHIIYQGAPAGNISHSVQLVVGCANIVDIRFGTLKHFPKYMIKIARSARRTSRAQVTS